MKFEKLKELRESANLSQQELSDKLGFNRGSYASCEQGKCNPTIDVLKKLSTFFNVSIDYLLENDTRGLTVYSEEQNQAINMLVQLNELNLSRASSYIAGLLVGQN